MEALTVSAVRHLVKLYRGEVEGADEQLDALIETRAEDLADILGFPKAKIPLLLENEHRVELLAQTVEAAGRRDHERRQQDGRTRAAQLLGLLITHARVHDARSIQLEPAILAELVSCAGYDWLIVDPELRLGISRALLRAFFRECRGVEVHGAWLTPNSLALSYAGPRSRGVVRLATLPVPYDANALEAHFPPPRPPEPIVEEPSPSIVEEPPPMNRRRQPPRAPSRQPREAPAPAGVSADAVITASPDASPPVAPAVVATRPGPRVPAALGRPQPRVHGFLRHLINAASEVLR